MVAQPSTAHRAAARAARALLLLAALATTGGCASLPSQDARGRGPADATAAGAPAPTPVAALDRIGVAPAGSVVALPADNALGVTRVRVLDEYHAASGRQCRRVALPNRAATRVVCRARDGGWTPVRSLLTGFRAAPPRLVDGDEESRPAPTGG